MGVIKKRMIWIPPRAAVLLISISVAPAIGPGGCAPRRPRPPEIPQLALHKEKHPVPKPTKVIGLIANYPPADASAPVGSPAFFVRSVNALIAHGEIVPVPEGYDSVLYEGELVIVIGKQASKVKPEEAGDCILGYTCGMDGSPVKLNADGERDVARSLAGKSADSVAPVGPWVVKGIDPAEQEIQIRVNGELVERCHARDLIWDPLRIITEISRNITLEPGDLIFTGASRAIPKFRPGDRVEVEITDVGILSNYIAWKPEERGTASTR